MKKEFEELIVFLEEINSKLKKDVKEEEFIFLKEDLFKIDSYYNSLNRIIEYSKKVDLQNNDFEIFQKLNNIKEVLIRFEFTLLRIYKLVDDIIVLSEEGFKFK